MCGFNWESNGWHEDEDYQHYTWPEERARIAKKKGEIDARRKADGKGDGPEQDRDEPDTREGKSEWASRKGNKKTREAAYGRIDEKIILSSTMKAIVTRIGWKEVPVGHKFGGNLVMEEERYVERIGSVPVVRAWTHCDRHGREGTVFWPIGTDTPERCVEKILTMKQDVLVIMHDKGVGEALAEQPDKAKSAYRYDKSNSDIMYGHIENFLLRGYAPARGEKFDMEKIIDEERRETRAHKYVVIGHDLILYRKMSVANKQPAKIRDREKPTLTIRIKNGKPDSIAGKHMMKATLSNDGKEITVVTGGEVLTARWEWEQDRLVQSSWELLEEKREMPEKMPVWYAAKKEEDGTPSITGEMHDMKKNPTFDPRWRKVAKMARMAERRLRNCSYDALVEINTIIDRDAERHNAEPENTG